MCIYYIIHNLTNKGENENNGAKNARTFIFGSIMYIILYMGLMHFSLKYPFSHGIFKTGLIMLLLSDVATMGYIYKAYYGRLIFNELSVNDEEDTKWKFDESTHKYKLKNANDKALDEEKSNIEYEQQMNEIHEIHSKFNSLPSKTELMANSNGENDGDGNIDEKPDMMLTDFPTTSGTKNINTALGDAFNTTGESNENQFVESNENQFVESNEKSNEIHYESN